MTANAGGSVTRSGAIKGPQSFISGLVLVVLALVAIWLTRDLPQGTLRSMGPAMLPRWLAIAVGLCGLALVVIGLLRPGSDLETYTIRGPLVVVVAIIAFGVTIRGFDLGRNRWMAAKVAGRRAGFPPGCIRI